MDSSPAEINAYLTWLHKEPLYPKVYWQSREKDLLVAGCGASTLLTHFPKRDSTSSSRFFGGLSFCSKKKGFFPPCFFFSPHKGIEKKKATTTLFNMKNRALDLPFEEGKKPEIIGRSDSISQRDWHKKITNYLTLIQKGELKKIVAARRTTLYFKEALSPFALLYELQKIAKNATLFGVQIDATRAFIGATPEKLFSRQKNHLFCEALAATAPLNKKEALLHPKEQEEFHLVSDFIEQKLSSFCTTLYKEAPSIMTTSHLHHLYNRFYGTLREEISDEEIIAHLHPTPAMAGIPTSSALKYIQKEEPFTRSWYAAPIGWIAGEESEFCVGIRSAYVESHTLHLFAATGIVAGSDPDAEWEELEAKIAPFLSLVTHTCTQGGKNGY